MVFRFISIKHESKGKMCNTETEVIGMLEFLNDSIFVEFRWRSSQILIVMGTNYSLFLSIISCTPMRPSLYKNVAIEKLITEGKAFNIIFRYSDDFLSINNSNCDN